MIYFNGSAFFGADGDELTEEEALSAALPFVVVNVKLCDLRGLPWVVEVAGPQPSEVLGGTAKNGQRIMTPKAWGVDGARTVEAAIREIGAFQEALVGVGGTVRKTLASTALGDAWRFLPGGRNNVEMRPLPPRYRRLAVMACHPGPMVHVRANILDGATYDRNRAYFQALSKPLPTAGTWTPIKRGAPWRAVRPLDGIVEATVRIAPGGYLGAFPPLPVRDEIPVCNFHGLGPRAYRVESCYPVGTFRGVWTTPLLRFAESVGAEILEIHDGFYFALTPWWGPVIDVWGTYPKVVLKPFYTRLWGKLAHSAWWNSRRDEQGAWGPWRQIQADPMGRMLPGYRPDVAAWVLSDNALEMARTIASYTRDDFAMSHVDAVWVRERPAQTDYLYPADLWKCEARGNIRVWGQGVYSVGADYFGGQGIPHAVEGPDDIEAWYAARMLEGTAWLSPGGRIWDSDPRTNHEAVSTDPPETNGALWGVPGRPWQEREPW